MARKKATTEIEDVIKTTTEPSVTEEVIDVLGPITITDIEGDGTEAITEPVGEVVLDTAVEPIEDVVEEKPKKRKKKTEKVAEEVQEETVEEQPKVEFNPDEELPENVIRQTIKLHNFTTVYRDEALTYPLIKVYGDATLIDIITPKVLRVKVMFNGRPVIGYIKRGSVR